MNNAPMYKGHIQQTLEGQAKKQKKGIQKNYSLNKHPTNLQNQLKAKSLHLCKTRTPIRGC